MPLRTGQIILLLFSSQTISYDKSCSKQSGKGDVGLKRGSVISLWATSTVNSVPYWVSTLPHKRPWLLVTISAFLTVADQTATDVGPIYYIHVV